MAGQHALYQGIILDHNRNPRNYRAMADATARAEAHNPLCGDWFTVYLKTEDDVIIDASFSGSGCAIAKASASVMTAYLRGKTVAETVDVCARFQALVTASPGAPADPALTGDIAAFCGVREYPVRAKCAMLPWRAALAALEAPHGDQREK